MVPIQYSGWAWHWKQRIARMYGLTHWGGMIRSFDTSVHTLVAMFDAALGLAPDWEKPAFCYAVYLDQLMVDAQRRQLKLQEAQQQLLQKVRRTVPAVVKLPAPPSLRNYEAARWTLRDSSPPASVPACFGWDAGNKST